VTAREIRALLEAALDELSWPYVRAISLMIDTLLQREGDRL
jgi:hypothetical protein